MCENVQNCCRICLDMESDHISILGDPIICLHVKSCLAITISANDDLPKGICMPCVSQLSKFYNFQLNARCSQDWLESSIQEKSKKSTETKTHIQPLPDSEYNSDSLLEFLNNTANIEEYLNNLGKEDIPSIVSMFDKNNENFMDAIKLTHIKTKPSPKKKECPVKAKKRKVNMEIDILDSDIEIVQELLMKEAEPKKTSPVKCPSYSTCFGCRTKFDSIQELSQHLSICDNALRTCIHCKALFNSKQSMLQHRVSHHTTFPVTCDCGKQVQSKDTLMQHYKICHLDFATTGCVYRCKQCGVMFKERFQLYKHAREHVVKSEERICDICGHSFIGNNALSKHRKEAHDRLDNLLYRCKICNFTSPEHKEIYIHVQKHTAKQQQSRHLCESCGHSFATHTSLMRHALQHKTSNEGLKCHICDKSFVDTKTRDKHILGHRDVTICEKCGQTVNSCKLDAHLCV